MKNKRKAATILAIFSVIFIVVGVVVGLGIVRSQDRTEEKLLKSIVEKMKQVQNYQFNLFGNYAGNQIESTVKAIREGNIHSLYVKTKLQVKDSKEPTESEFQYDFDLTEQRYLQKVLYQGKVIHINSFSSTEENPLDVDLLDATHLLVLLSDLLVKKNPAIQNDRCTISVTEEDVNSFLFMLELLTFHTSEEVLSGNALQITYQLNKKKQIIENISFYQGEKEIFEFTFQNFGTSTFSF